MIEHVRVTIADDATGKNVQMELAGETTIDEIIEAASEHWRKPRGAYVLRWQSALLPGEMRIGEVGFDAAESLTLLPDPEGG